MCRFCAVFATVFALGVPFSASAQDEPLVRGVERALAVHLPPEGLATLGDAVEAVVPDHFTIEETVDTFDCSDDTTILYGLAATDLLFSTDEVALDTGDGTLDVTLYGTIDSTASTLGVIGDCGPLTGLWEECAVQFPTTAVEVHLSVALFPISGGIDAVAQPVEVLISPIGNPLSDCTLASAVGTLLGQDEYAISAILIDAISPALADLPAEIEGAIEEGFNSFAVDTVVDVLGTPLSLQLYPSLVEISEDGVIVGMGADVSTQVAACVNAEGFPLPDPNWPQFATVAPGTTLAYDAGVYIGADFVDELLLSVWASGAMCMEIDTLADVPLQGALVGAFFGAETGDLIGSDTPATLVLSGDIPPVTGFDEDQPAVVVDMPELHLDLVSELDYRQARILQVGVDAVVGLDVALQDQTIAPTLEIDQEAFVFSETYTELVSPGYSAGLGTLLDTVLQIAVPDEALTEVVLPQPLGIAVDEVFWIPTPNGQWLGGYGLLDLSNVQRIDAPGCSADAGCDGGSGIEFDLNSALGCDDPESGCGDEGGCSSGSVPARPVYGLALLLVLVPLRRRRA